MDEYEFNSKKTYEVWGLHHKDQVNYPDRIFITTDIYEKAADMEVPASYTKAILEILVTRKPLGLCK